MEGFGDEKLAKFLKAVVQDFQADNDTTRALRRLHMKKVHLRREGDLRHLRLVKGIRRFIV